MRKNTRSKQKHTDVPLSELRTRAEQRIESASKDRMVHRTPQTRSLRSQPVSQLMSQHMSQMQDDQQQERQDLFTITEEEQKRMRAMLDLFRRGKITKDNAFQIPLKVIGGDTMANNNLNIWRMASDMLSVSSSIYDKRVENAHDDSTKLHSLLSHKEQQQSMMKSQSKSKEKNPFDPKMFENLKPIKGSGGSATLQDQDKISCSLNDICQTDLMFHRARRVFDTSSTSGLLLNTFTISEHISISLTESVKQLQPTRINTNFSQAFTDISSSDCHVFQLFKKAQTELIEMYNSLQAPLPEQPQYKLAPQDDNEVSRIAQMIVLTQPIYESVQTVSAYSQPMPDPPQETVSTRQAYRSQGAYSEGMSGSRVQQIHMEYDQLSMRSEDIGSGDQDFLQQYNSPWDVPNYFKKKRNISKNKNKSKQPKKARETKDIWPKFDQRLITDRGFLKAKTTKSKSKSGYTIQDISDIENMHLYTHTPDNYFFANRGNYKDLKGRTIIRNIQMAENVGGEQVIQEQPNLEHRPQEVQSSQPIELNFQAPISSEEHEQPRLNVFSSEPVQQNQKQISMKQYKNRLYRQIVEGVHQLTALRKEETISVQATFVALLHLANEKQLALEGNVKGDNFSIKQNKKMETE